MASVVFRQFLNVGTGISQRRLGPIDITFYRLNGVELQFDVGGPAVAADRNLALRQWSGPEGVWTKTGAPLNVPWTLVRRSQGSGADDPMPESVVRQNDIFAMWDSPGPQMTGYVGRGISRVYVVQNFTTWVEGQSIRTGQVERLSAVAAWHGVCDLVSMDWAEGGTSWSRMPQNRTGTGWVDTSGSPPGF